MHIKGHHKQSWNIHKRRMKPKIAFEKFQIIENTNKPCLGLNMQQNG